VAGSSRPATLTVGSGPRRTVLVVTVEDELRRRWRRDGCVCNPTISSWRPLVVVHSARCPLVERLDREERDRAREFDGERSGSGRTPVRVPRPVRVAAGTRQIDAPMGCQGASAVLANQ
jgi:hypothetical protein